MGIKTNSQPQRANLTYTEMQRALPRIDIRISELEAFDVNKMQTMEDASRIALEHKVDDLLMSIFGHNTVEYLKYQDICKLYKPVIILGIGDNVAEIRERTQRGIFKAIAVLKTIKEIFNENLQESVAPGSALNAIKAYEGLELQIDIAAATHSLFLSGHHAEAVEKAMKAFNELIRTKSGSKLDGSKLMELVFSANDPILALNKLNDASDKDEQRGFMLMASGAALCIRNPRAHKIVEDEATWALEAIAFISFMSKWVDKTTRVKTA